MNILFQKGEFQTIEQLTKYYMIVEYNFIFLLNMAQLVSDTIYKDLKQRGLELSPCAKVTVPEPQTAKTSLVKKLSSLVIKPKIQQETDRPVQIIQVMYSAFMAIRKNTIFIYKYTYQEESQKIQISYEGILILPYTVQQVFPCPSKYVQDTQFPFIVKSKNGISYMSFDLKQNSITQRSFYKLSNIYGVGWLNYRQCLVYHGDSLSHYIITQGLLQQKSIRQSNLLVSENQILKSMWVIGTAIDEHQDSIVPTFYSTIDKSQINQQNPPIKLKVKQFLRTLDGDIISCQKPDYIIQTRNLSYKPNFKIIAVNDYFCVQLTNQVLVIKKKFQKYLILDNMMEVMPEYHIVLNRKGIVISIGQNLLQLNCILFSDPKCATRVCDVIEFPEQLKGYHKYFREVWPITNSNSKQYTLIFLFENQNEITLSGLVKLEPMAKMLALAKKDTKKNLNMVQQMALNLGIAKKDFYLKLWSTSKKQNGDIYNYLIPCQDIDSIKKQLKSTLRTRTIQVTQMIKILNKDVSRINLQNLRENLNQKNLKQYLKTHFLVKKLYLNHMNYPLDHRIFNKIYSSSLLDVCCDIVRQELDPVKPKYDPLHTNYNLQPQKQQKTLEVVLQKFKIVILEEYKTFLIQFLSHFPKKLVEVLQRFTFLLPNHPFQIEVQKPSATNQLVLKDPKKNGTAQQIWFQTVKVQEWVHQVTKQRILKELFDDFQTSKIIQTVDQFSNSLYGRQNKRWKHGLIVTNLDQYSKKLKSICNTQLYLDVCQFANELSISGNGDPKVSQKILQILERKNGLCDPDLHTCKLYANMHYFMLKHKIIPKPKLQISYLMSLKPQNLVAVFFLQNKQRKQHVFQQFKNLYQNKQEFQSVLQKFVQSQNCSRIQLQILMKQFKSKGYKFQQDNQDILDILITGICMKVEIREGLLLLDNDQADDQEVETQIDQIQLSKNLALKVNRVKKLKLCKCIFQRFGLEKMTYKQLLDLESQNQIFKMILRKYFELKDNEERTEDLTIVIQEEQINLQNPRNILTVLIYLQQNVYYLAKTFDILVLFGLQLILWKQFDVIRNLVNDQNAMNTLNISRQQYIEQLTLRALDLIYLDQQIVYQQQTKQQILQILNIDTQMSPLKIRQQAKLNIVDIFTSWGLQVHPSDIHTICFQWKDQNRAQIIEDIVNHYIDHLDFKIYEEIYRLLEIVDKESYDVCTINVQYMKYCDLYAKKLIKKQRYLEAAEVVAFLMHHQPQIVEYSMLAQAYLQNVIQIFAQDMVNGRKLIELFAQFYQTSQKTIIVSLLQNGFRSIHTQISFWQPYRSTAIHIRNNYIYEQAKKLAEVQIQVENLWQIAQKASNTNVRDLYTNFFFLVMGLTNPSVGFGELLGISYDLQKVSNLIFGQLDNLFNKDESLWYVNYSLIQYHFVFQGMLGVAAYSLGQHIEKGRKEESRQKFQLIMGQLKKSKNENQRNQFLYSILNKLKNQILNLNKLVSRKDRAKQKIRQQAQKLQQKSKQIQQVEEEPVDVIQQSQVFLNWKKVLEEKKSITSQSHVLLSEKELIDHVYLANFDNSKIKDKKPQRQQMGSKRHILSNLFLNTKFVDKLGGVPGLIKNRKFQILASYPLNQVIAGIQKLFADDPALDYREIIDILDGLNIGDAEKRNIFRVARIYLDYLPNQSRKILFPLQFFLIPLAPADSEQKKSSNIYNELAPNMQILFKTNSMNDIRELANLFENIVSSNSTKFSALVYLDQLLYIGRNAAFNSNAALIAQQCITGMMASYPQIISERYREVLDAIVDKQMKIFVKQIIIKVLSEKQNYIDIAESIRKQYEIIN